MTLPGFDAYPDPAPARTAVGYLSWLAEQPYPGRLGVLVPGGLQRAPGG